VVEDRRHQQGVRAAGFGVKPGADHLARGVADDAGVDGRLARVLRLDEFQTAAQLGVREQRPLAGAAARTDAVHAMIKQVARLRTEGRLVQFARLVKRHDHRRDHACHFPDVHYISLSRLPVVIARR
jgi:hypothetical protein